MQQHGSSKNDLGNDQAWTEYAPDADRARSGVQNLWDEHNFSGVKILPRKKEKIIRSTSLQSNRQNNEKVIVKSKYYRQNQCTCDILMFIYLMVSKLLYLLMD